MRVHRALGFGFLESASGGALELEFKAIKSITKVEWAQVIHYLRATRIPHALLLNFGRPQLQCDTLDLDSLPQAPDASLPC